MTDYTIMVIDDERTLPISEIPVLLFRNSRDGLAALKDIHTSMGRINELWLDHDLGYDEEKDKAGSGWPFDDIMPVVSWLEEQGQGGTPFDVDMIVVHTQNPAAAPQMMDALRPYYNVIRAPWPL